MPVRTTVRQSRGRAGLHSCSVMRIGDTERLLHLELDRTFGSSFSSVLDYEFRRRISKSLYESLCNGPEGAKRTLKDIFRSERAVYLIFRALAHGLRNARESPEGRELLSMVESALRRPS